MIFHSSLLSETGDLTPSHCDYFLPFFPPSSPLSSFLPPFLLPGSGMESLLDFETVEAVLGESFGQQVGIKWFILCLTVLWRHWRLCWGNHSDSRWGQKGKGSEAKRRGGK